MAECSWTAEDQDFIEQRVCFREGIVTPVQKTSVGICVCKLGTPMHIVVLLFQNYSKVHNIFKGRIMGGLSEKFIQSSKTLKFLTLIRNIPQSQHLQSSHKLHMGQLFLVHLLYFHSVW